MLWMIKDPLISGLLGLTTLIDPPTGITAPIQPIELFLLLFDPESFCLERFESLSRLLGLDFAFFLFAFDDEVLVCLRAREATCPDLRDWYASSSSSFWYASSLSSSSSSDDDDEEDNSIFSCFTAGRPVERLGLV